MHVGKCIGCIDLWREEATVPGVDASKEGQIQVTNNKVFDFQKRSIGGGRTDGDMEHTGLRA